MTEKEKMFMQKPKTVLVMDIIYYQEQLELERRQYREAKTELEKFRYEAGRATAKVLGMAEAIKHLTAVASLK